MDGFSRMAILESMIVLSKWEDPRWRMKIRPFLLRFHVTVLEGAIDNL
jgi:hypothetical protein